jgi:hypothetical protein
VGNQKAKKPKSPQFVGQTKAVGQYSLDSWPLLAYCSSGKIFGPLKWYTDQNFFGDGGGVAEINLFLENFFGSGRAQSEKVGQISFCPPNFFLPVRPCMYSTSLSPVAKPDQQFGHAVQILNHHHSFR